MISNHINFKVKSSGLIISIVESMFAAFPGGIISCDCCGIGCLEIKCPYRLFENNWDIKTFALTKDTFLDVQDDEISLNNNHQYFFQVQLQMYVTQTLYCDFVVWSATCMNIERIFFNEEFLNINIAKAKIFYSSVIIPEILVRWYTKSPIEVLQEVWCICKGFDDGRMMICCANEDCSIKLYHMQCIGMSQINKNAYWFCETCSQILFKDYL